MQLLPRRRGGESALQYEKARQSQRSRAGRARPHIAADI